MSTLGAILAAASRAKGVVRRTPLLSSPFLDEIAGRRIFIKAECLQHTGSFKFRGAWSALTALPETQRQAGVLAFSSGNHAQGVAFAAKHLGVPAVIVMPRDAPQLKINNTMALGADVVLYDRVGGEDREALGARLSAERGLTLIKPFDEPMVIAGQGTCGLEIAEQATDLSIAQADVLVCCGGGGFTSGIALALAERAPAYRVRPVEPTGFDDMTRSLVAGERLANTGPEQGLCDAILTPMPGEITFPIISKLCGPGLVVTDGQVKAAMRHAFTRLKLVLEPGGSVALAAALFQPERLASNDVIVTVSGGNVEPALFAEILAEPQRTEAVA